uniref:J domain-containing protein n=1 Tax=Toxocara canis TaxID=6265 RepID=A0A183V3B1_TOXCA
LFENEDEESDNDVEVLISNRHFGAKGAKLMAMEAKFSNDERFRMNEKFFEDSNEQEEDEEKMEVEKEKKAKLEILSKVLGKAVRNSVRGKRAAPFSRFDPDNQNHIRWLNEQKLQTAECDQESVEKEDEVDRGTVRKEEEEEEAEKNKMGESRVIEGQYFDVDETFAESLKRTLKIQGSSNETQNGFSFLKSIGRVHSADVETGLEEPKPVSSLTKQSLLPEQIYKGQRKLALKRKKEEESRAFRVQLPTLQQKRKRRNVLSDQCKSQDDELYALLGCPKTATIAQIMAEYRARVRDCHPDTAEGDLNEANEHFLRLQQAKEILTDERKKRIYDDWLNSSISVPWKLWMENSELRMVMINLFYSTLTQ